MAIVFNQKVTVNKGARNKNYYTRLGYQKCEDNKAMEVDIKHLLPNAGMQVELVCDCCGEKFHRGYNKLKSPNHFCGRECYRKWYAEVWSQQKSWRIESQKRAVEILSHGLISKTDSGCQIIVNEILDNLKIDYENERSFVYVSIDNYLIDCDLAIEVMGTYWHTDPREYKIIKYQSQYDRIVYDKRKRGILKNSHNIDILYLWEYDIENNSSLCEKLINYYIANQGIMENYHSFNFYIDDNNNLKLNENVIKSYFEHESGFITSIFEPTDGIKRSLKQHDKWIVFNCENCGEETEQLKSRHILRDNHFCSNECKKLSQQHGESTSLGGVNYNCDCCGNEFIARNYLYEGLKTGKRENLFCSYDCHHDWQRVNGIDSDENGKPYKKDFLKSEFYRFEGIFNRYPSISDFNENDEFPSVKLYELKWGSWKKFVDSLDIISSDGWYKHDDEVLKKYYLDKDIEFVTDKLMANYTHGTIRRRARKLGLFIRPVNELKITKGRFIEKYMMQKMTRTEIARENGITLLMVDKFMAENDIEKIKENKWEKSQVMYLRDNYANGSWDELLENLQPFNKKSITKKANAIGIKRMLC